MNKRCNQSRPHSRCVLTTGRFAIDLGVGSLDSMLKEHSRISLSALEGFNERLHGKTTRALAARVTSHAVTDNDQQPVSRFADGEEVLVARAPAPDIGARCDAICLRATGRCVVRIHAVKSSSKSDALHCLLYY